jgi:DNA polymerase III gamma/tau subunit
LLAHLRDLLVAKVSGDASELLESSATDRKELVRQAAAFNESDLVRFFHSLTETENNLRVAAHPRYQLEVGLVKLMEMRRLHGLDQLIERISALEESLRTGGAPARTAGGSAPPSPAAGGQKSGMGGGKPSSFQGAAQTRASHPNAASNKDIPAAATTSSSTSPTEEAPFGGVGATTRAASTTNAPNLTLVSAPNAPPQESQAHTTVALKVPAAEKTQADAKYDSDVKHDSEDFRLDQEDSVGPAVPVAAASSAQGSFVERIKAALEDRRRMFLVTSLDGARRVAVEGEELCIEFAPEMKHLRDTLAKPESVKILRDVCRELAGRDMGVRISIKEQGTAANDAPSSKAEEERREKQRLREMAEQHPAVQRMLKTFRGEIVDVKRIDTDG